MDATQILPRMYVIGSDGECERFAFGVNGCHRPAERRRARHHNGVVAGDVQSLKKALSELKVPNAEVEELGAILIEEPQLTPSGTYGPKLSKWVGKLVEKSADGSWKVAIGAAGGLLASALRAYFHMGP